LGESALSRCRVVFCEAAILRQSADGLRIALPSAHGRFSVGGDDTSTRILIVEADQEVSRRDPIIDLDGNVHDAPRRLRADFDLPSARFHSARRRSRPR
jgi:hypothetical protein